MTAVDPTVVDAVQNHPFVRGMTPEHCNALARSPVPSRSPREPCCFARVTKSTSFSCW